MVVIKNVLPERESLAMKESLKEHIRRNSWAKGFPSLRLRSLHKAKNHSLPGRLTGGLRTILVLGAARRESPPIPHSLPVFRKLPLALFAPVIGGEHLRVSAIRRPVPYPPTGGCGLCSRSTHRRRECGALGGSRIFPLLREDLDREMGGVRSL